MTHVLDQAITQIERLPAEEQDRIGQWLLEELASEHRWEERFSASQGALKKLVDQAREEIAKGTVTDLDPDKL